MKLKNIFLLFVSILATGVSFAQATLPAFWNCNDPAAAPTGWTLSQGSSGNFVYTSTALVKSSPASVRLDNTGEFVQVNFTGTADTVFYYITGTAASGATAWVGTFVVQESANGTDWTDVSTFKDDLGLTLKERFTLLSTTTKYVRFFFKSKSSGYNIAIDDITVSDGIGGAKPELVVEYSGNNLASGKEIRVGGADIVDLTIKNNSSAGDLIISDLKKSGVNAADFTTTQTFPFTVKAGETATLSIDVNKNVTSGSLKATLEIFSNDSNNLPFTVNVFAIRGGSASEPTTPSSTVSVKTNFAWRSIVTLSGGSEPVDGYLILLGKGSDVSGTPQDGIEYERGGYIGNDRVLHVGTAGEVTFDNIVANTQYFIKVFSYNGYGSFTNYFTGSATAVNYTTPGLNPGGYYGALTASDTQLIDKLRGIVRPHFQVYYSNFGSTIASNFEARDTTGGKKVINCFYSGFPYIFTPPFFFNTADPDYLSREHSYPYSWMPESSQDSANYSDLHLLYLVHQNKVNASRSNYPYNNLKSVTVNFYGGKFGLDSAGEFAYEPRDFAKGAVARSQFYICATYNRPGKTFTIPTSNEFLGMNQDQTVLKRWNQQFPPTNWEIARHEYIAGVQKNRNPFVDNPDWACFIDFSKMKYVAGGNCSANNSNSVREKKNIVNVTSFPVPAKDQLSIDLSAFNSENVTITLTDFYERTVVSLSCQDKLVTIPTGALSSGTYLLLVEGKTKHAAQAVVIAK